MLIRVLTNKMVCVVDEGSFVLVVGSILSIIAFLSLYFIGNSPWMWLQFVFSLMVGLFSYAILHTTNPIIFSRSVVLVSGTIFIISATVFVLLRIRRRHFRWRLALAGLVCLLILAPFATNNGDLIVQWMKIHIDNNTPVWAGAAVMAALCLIMICFLYCTRMLVYLPLFIVNATCAVMCTAYCRLGWLETRDSETYVNPYRICCFDAYTDPDPIQAQADTHRCPFSINSIGVLFAFVFFFISSSTLSHHAFNQHSSNHHEGGDEDESEED